MVGYLKGIPILPTALGLSLILIATHRFLPIVPSVGYLLLFALTTIFIVSHIRTRKGIETGPKAISMPILVLLLITVIQAIIGTTSPPAMAFMLTMVLVYLMSLEYDKKAFTLFFPALVIVGLSCIIIHGIINPGSRGGGLLHPYNYNIATAFLALGLVLTRGRYQWILAALVLPGLVFTGADQAIIFIICFGLLTLVKRDYSKKSLVPALTLVLLITVFLSMGVTQVQYLPAIDRLRTTQELPTAQDTDAELDEALGYRWFIYKEAVVDIKILGHGFDPTDASKDSIHNVPLKILYEMGPIAMLIWLWLVGYGIFKLKRTYIFSTILILSVFDNMVWTQLTPYMFIALGVKLTTDDHMFKTNNKQ